MGSSLIHYIAVMKFVKHNQDWNYNHIIFLTFLLYWSI